MRALSQYLLHCTSGKVLQGKEASYQLSTAVQKSDSHSSQVCRTQAWDVQSRPPNCQESHLLVSPKVYLEGEQSGTILVENIFYRSSLYWSMDHFFREVPFSCWASPDDTASQSRWTVKTNQRLSMARGAARATATSGLTLLITGRVWTVANCSLVWCAVLGDS